MKSIRRYLLPRLLMPSSFGLPPVVCCFGTSPSHAPRSRPRLKEPASPIAATSAVALRTPMPGIVVSRRAAASERASSTNSALSDAIRRSRSRHSARMSTTSWCMRPLRCEGRIIEKGIQRPLERASAGGEDVAALQQDRPQLIEERLSGRDQPRANPMQRLNVELLLALELDIAHRWS